MKHIPFLLIKYFIVLATSMFTIGQLTADGCVHCGGEVSEHEVEISENDEIIFCKTHEAGSVELGREHGIRVFGNLEAYFRNLYRVQCPAYYPSPHYYSINNAPFERELMKDLDYIHEFLSDEERAFFLNRPATGAERFTLLGLAIMGKERAIRYDQSAGIEAYDRIINKLKAMGAKTREEMTSEELAVYD